MHEELFTISLLLIWFSEFFFLSKAIKGATGQEAALIMRLHLLQVGCKEEGGGGGG